LEVRVSKKRLAFVVIVIFALLIVNAMAHVRANPIISRAKVTLMEDKTAALSVSAKVSCEFIGTVRYVLYKSDGVVVKSATINDFGRGFKHTSFVDLSSSIIAGNSYYFIAYFSADGETSNCTSGILSY
jgi:hypothetical protein